MLVWELTIPPCNGIQYTFRTRYLQVGYCYSGPEDPPFAADSGSFVHSIRHISISSYTGMPDAFTLKMVIRQTADHAVAGDNRILFDNNI